MGEVEEYDYLCVTVKAGLNSGFKNMVDIMLDVMEFDVICVSSYWLCVKSLLQYG